MLYNKGPGTKNRLAIVKKIYNQADIQAPIDVGITLGSTGLFSLYKQSSDYYPRGVVCGICLFPDHC